MTLKTIMDLIIKTFDNNNHDYKAWIKELNQVEASIKRDKGAEFPYNDHLKGMILSLLSAQRPWKPISRNLDVISGIFHDYDRDTIYETDPDHFVDELKGRVLGNRRIKKQMRNLKYNIEKFDIIAREFGSLDNFVTSQSPMNIADAISDELSPYKLKEIGYALAMEYLRNVGIKAVKPDTLLIRLVAPQRLGLINYQPTAEEVGEYLTLQSNNEGINPIFLDNLMWLLCANGYGEICTENNPKCHLCELRGICKYSK